MSDCKYCSENGKCIRDKCVKCCDCSKILIPGGKLEPDAPLHKARLVLYKNYCGHCHHTEILQKGVRTGRYTYHPERCRYCSPKSFTDKLGTYVNLDYDIVRFTRERDTAQKGMEFSRNRQNALRSELSEHVEEHTTRVIPLGGTTIVLDYTDGFRILFAQPERNPDA